MAETFTILRAEKKADKPDKGYGPMQVILLELETANGPVVADWFTKAATPVPAAGGQLVGDLKAGEYGMQFKKAPAFTGGGAPRPEDPQRQKRIVRQHSQSMALATLKLAADLGVLIPGSDPMPQNTADLFSLIAKTADWFDADVEKAVA